MVIYGQIVYSVCRGSVVKEYSSAHILFAMLNCLKNYLCQTIITMWSSMCQKSWVIFWTLKNAYCKTVYVVIMNGKAEEHLGLISYQKNEKVEMENLTSDLSFTSAFYCCRWLSTGHILIWGLYGNSKRLSSGNIFSYNAVL